MNYEVDLYIEAQRDLPSREIVLETRDADYYHFKADVLAGKVTYSTDKNNGANLVTIPKTRAFEVISMNKQGKKPLNLAAQHEAVARGKDDFNGKDLLEEESITRFDTQLGSQSKRRRKSRKRRSNVSQQTETSSGESSRKETTSRDVSSKDSIPNAGMRTEGKPNAGTRTVKRGQRRSRPSNKRRSSGDRKPSGERKSPGERKSSGGRRSSGETKSSAGEKKSRGRDD